jgi:predicted ATP-grasp superfamily ATP-dependent carboligase
MFRNVSIFIRRKMRKNILFVDWGTRDKIYPFEAAKRKNLNIFLTTGKFYPKWVEKFVPPKNLIITNNYDSEKLIIDVLAFTHKNKIKFHGVTTFFEMCVIQTADLANVLDCRFISPQAARQSSANKLLMRIKTKKGGILNPEFDVFTSPEKGFEILKKIGAPAIIKPVKSGHSFGAVYLDKVEKKSFLKFYSDARKQLDSNADEWMRYYNNYKNDFLIEEYLKGKVVSVDGLIQDKKIVFLGTASFILSKLPYFIQEGVYLPADINPKANGEIVNLTKKILKILDFDNCGFHCELKMTPKGPYLLEIACRPPGGYMLEGYKEAYGIDFAGLYLEICLGNKVKPQKSKVKKFVVQRGLTAQKKGIIKKVLGIEKIKKVKNLQRLNFYKKGDWVDYSYEGPDALLYYHLSAKTKKELKINEQFVRNSVKFEYYPKIYYQYRRLRKNLKKCLTFLKNQNQS